MILSYHDSKLRKEGPPMIDEVAYAQCMGMKAWLDSLKPTGRKAVSTVCSLILEPSWWTMSAVLTVDSAVVCPCAPIAIRGWQGVGGGGAVLPETRVREIVRLAPKEKEKGYVSRLLNL